MKQALSGNNAQDDKTTGEQLTGQLHARSQLHLLPLTNVVEEEQALAAAATATGHVFACDFAIHGAEQWEEKPWGYEKGRLVNIDHHALTPRMRRHVSSTNLALLYVASNGIAQPEDALVINHTDCDSVLACAILRADLEPHPRYGEAAIAADHTGAENPIADLLQALDKKRDYEYSLDNLRRLLAGKPLDEAAQAALEVRCAKQNTAFALVQAGDFAQAGAFAQQNGVMWAELDAAIEGEFFPALLPEAIVIALFSLRDEKVEDQDEGAARSQTNAHVQKWNAKFRLGHSAPQGFSLQDVIAPIDLGYGGRWNAGSNKRAGGSHLSPAEYVTALAQNMAHTVVHK